MLHTSKVKQSSNTFSSFCIMSKGLPLCPFLFQTFPFAPIAHFHSRTCLVTQTSFFWALCLLLGSLHKARDEEDVCLLFPQVYQTINNIHSSVSCSMQDATEVPSAGLSIYFPGLHFIWSSIKQSWLSRKFVF